jgi:hypothetical protein
MTKWVLTMIGRAAATVAAAYGGYVTLTYLRLGRRPGETAAKSLLDQVMPEYEVRERHSVRVAAPAETTFATAREISFRDSPLAEAIFALRALPARLLGAPRPSTERRRILDEVIALGWREVAQVPHRRVVMAAVTQPWKQEVQFQGLPAEEFVAFREAGYAKIAWTLEVEPAGPKASIFSTETRVMTTDPVSRERFRRYWAFLSPGILIIRYEILRLVRVEAERRSVGMSRASQASAIRSAP